MIRGVPALKCRGGVGPLIAIPAGYLHAVKAMESSSSSVGGSPNTHDAQQQQRNFSKTSRSFNPAGVGRIRSDVENRGPTSISAGVANTTNVEREMSKVAQISIGAKPRKGSFGGLGSAPQKSLPFTSQAPHIQFGTVDLGDSTFSTSNSFSDDLPQLPNKVGRPHDATQQTVTPGWNKVPVDHGLESKKASPLPLKGTSGIDSNVKSEVMSPESSAEPHLGGGPQRLPAGGGERSSKVAVPATPPPPSTHDKDFHALGAISAAGRNRKVEKKGRGRGPVERAEAPLPSQHQEGKQNYESDCLASVPAIQKMEGQRNSNQSSKDASYDKRKADDRQGAELGNGLETGGRRHSWHINPGSDAIDALGRLLTRILRHQAVELKLEMSIDGYVDVLDLLNLSMKTHANRPLLSHTIDDVKQVVEEDNKQRFGIKEEKGRLFIRANQGHTIKSLKAEDLLKPIVSADEISVCVHGTYHKYLDQILNEGLKTMKRNHVHFATGLIGSEGVISGMRKTCDVLIYLNVEKALGDGMKLYISENKVILTEGFEGVVPPEYFKEVLRLPDLKPIAYPWMAA